MERSHAKGVKPNMREGRLRSGVNLQVALKARGVKQTWPKRRLLLFGSEFSGMRRKTDMAKTRVGCINPLAPEFPFKF